MATEMGEVISIDNFTSKMSRFDPSITTKTLYGLVDMGSNGIRFSISDLSGPRSRLLNCIYRERAGISLYDALHESSPDAQAFHFSEKSIKQVAQTLSRFGKICNDYGVEKQNISVFATEAMRTSKNRDEMLGAIKQASGLSVDILSPKMESLFGAMGARSGFHNVDGLFMDLGGGSVQMTYVNSTIEATYDVFAAEAAKSMPFGAAKLAAILVNEAEGHAAKKELRNIMKETFHGLTERFPELKRQAEDARGITIYFCGGGFRGYGSMLMHTDEIQPYPIPTIGGYTVAGHRFIKWREMLHANNYEEGKIFGMSKRRREQFPAIVTVVQALVEAVPKIKQVIFCSGGNREGVLYMKLPPEIRETDPLALLSTVAIPQEDHVAKAITTTVFSGLTTDYPAIFLPEIIHYIANHAWQEMGDPDGANSAKALHHPISGPLAGLPGLTHKTRAIVALIMCARWGSDLGPGDKMLANNLQALIGPELTWWCRYIGTIVCLIATILPVFPASVETVPENISLQASTSNGMGKKGHKVGIRLKIKLGPNAVAGLSVGGAEGLFDKIGKGLKVDWKVETEFTH